YIYAIVLVPIAITATTNAFNLLAGFNGVEAGMSIIIFITISIFALFKGNITLLLVLGAWIGALIGIYKYNKYPAKIFLGDAVTLVSGVLVGLSAIVLKLEWLIAFIYILYIIEFFIKASHNFKPECFGIPQKDGTLLARPDGGSLTHIVMRKGRFTEKQVVHIFYCLQTIICVIALLFFFF
ncbi:MAG TPA: UDP-N-acetylglucosamine--dolichyl-phosphate N-acetylglucosaminephosphotransferase, partial [Candidatus Diapherotrites archaeon]|nr:UDP-N-acetylglucosamine--dolichyl-phosphate N-acetylglucosaminephosphotransferase [Candidatus Diapherotrites archaeon]